MRHGGIRISGLVGRVRLTPPEESTANYDSKATIGYAITITDCPKDDGSSGDFGARITDGAAVLKHSIHMTSVRNAESGSKYDYKMYAIVHPDAKHCARPTLEQLGYKVLIRRAPVDSKYIEGQYLRENVSSDGCCGDKEFIKLHAYSLVDHPAIVHLDLDTLVLKPMDSLFDIIIQGPPTDGNNGGLGVAFGEPIVSSHLGSKHNINAFFTRDYDIAHREMKHVGVQGGFLVLRPSLLAFAEFSTLIRKGDFRADGGWGGLGFGPFSGSMSFQGIIPYFYDHFHPGTGVELNRCVYNNMADNPRDQPTENVPSGSCKDGYNRPDHNDQCEDCRSRPIEEVVTIHFRLCQKPWECPERDENRIQEDLCRQFHAEWYRIREDLETSIWGRKRLGLSNEHEVKKEKGGKYQYQHFRGYCWSHGKNGYIPLKAPLGTVRAGSAI
ncbi:hypothetical protein ACHAWX_002732 [Stephanocyclus meneghinianus]